MKEIEVEIPVDDTGKPVGTLTVDELRRSLMPQYQPIPVSVAADIASRFGKSIVIVAAWDPAFSLIHTTTFGVSAQDKEWAAKGGDLVNAALGGDPSKAIKFEDFHENFDAALFKESIDVLRLIAAQTYVSVPQLSQIRRLLFAFEGQPKENPDAT